MSHPASAVAVLLPGATPEQSAAVLGAMRAVAETGGAATQSDRLALEGAARYVFGHAGPFIFGDLAPVTPAALKAALAGTNLGNDAAKFLTVMALVDGKLDQAKIAAVLRYADALGISERYLNEVREAAEGHLQEALADMTRCNMESVTGMPWEGDVNAWLVPYGGAGADPALAQRFQALRSLGAETFGHVMWQHFTSNGYEFPGEPKALNVVFSIPHDSVHVLSGFDTSARGELLASTFTAAMHPKFPMAGHILPVIFSWHLQVQINQVAGETSNALDPVVFWQAWAAGAAATVDTFSPQWDFWAHVATPLKELRARYSIPVDGVEQAATPNRPKPARG